MQKSPVKQPSFSVYSVSRIDLVKAFLGRFTLTHFKLGIRLVDYKGNATTTDNFTIFMSRLCSFEGIDNSHYYSPMKKLPTRLGDAGQHTGVSQFPEFDTRKPELAVVTTSTASNLAA